MGDPVTSPCVWTCTCSCENASLHSLLQGEDRRDTSWSSWSPRPNAHACFWNQRPSCFSSLVGREWETRKPWKSVCVFQGPIHVSANRGETFLGVGGVYRYSYRPLLQIELGILPIIEVLDPHLDTIRESVALIRGMTTIM